MFSLSSLPFHFSFTLHLHATFHPFQLLPRSLFTTIYLRASTLWGTLLLRGVQSQSFRVGVLLLFHLVKPLLVLTGRTHQIQMIVRAWPKKSEKTKKKQAGCGSWRAKCCRPIAPTGLLLMVCSTDTKAARVHVRNCSVWATFWKLSGKKETAWLLKGQLLYLQPVLWLNLEYSCDLTKSAFCVSFKQTWKRYAAAGIV